MINNTITSIVKSVEKTLSDSWRSVYQEKREELSRMYEQYGDRAYGVWIQQFMGPVFERLTADGYIVKGGFNRTDSIENWGPPEERERCSWYVVKDRDETPVGTMVLQVYHSHRYFHAPRAPRLIALEATEREEIISALSNAAARIRWDIKDERLPSTSDIKAVDIRWEYATDVAIGDSLRSEDAQTNSWTLDEALSHWGRYGWELVSVLPTARQVVAFFKRPIPD